jgi:hypothetical protein
MIEVDMVVRLVGFDARPCQRALQKKRNSLNAGFIQAGLPQQSGAWWGPKRAVVTATLVQVEMLC